MGKRSFAERMNMHTDSSDPNACWLWGGYKDREGYGRARGDLAHRISYVTFVGPIPAGLQLDHLCRNRSCINPGHLEPVTARENTLRSTAASVLNARKTHCPQGHPYDEVNTYCDPVGRRHCRSCHRSRSIIRRQRERDTALPRPGHGDPDTDTKGPRG